MKLPDTEPLLRMVRKLAPVVGLAYFGIQLSVGMIQVLGMEPSIIELLGRTLEVAVMACLGATQMVVVALGFAETANCSAAIWGARDLVHTPYLEEVDNWLKWVGLATIGLSTFLWLLSLGGLLLNPQNYGIPGTYLGSQWTLTLIRWIAIGLAYFGFGEIVRLLRNLAEIQNMPRLQDAS